MAGPEKPAQVKRKHHYTPELYLSNFTDIRGVLHVISMRDGKRFQTTPRGVGFENHLYRPDVEGERPNVFEDMIADFEGDTAPALQEILTTRAMPTNAAQLQRLFNFIAFQAVRIPAMRQNISRPIEHTRRIIMDMVLHSKERFRAQVKKAGVDPDSVSYEQVKADFENHPSFPVATEEYLQHAMTMMNAMLPLLVDRTWSVVWSDQPGEQFIVSDHPVTLDWSDGRRRGVYGPGHAHMETDVTFPVGSSVALIGRFDPEVLTGQASTSMVAAINGRTFTYAQTFVAASSDEFPAVEDGNVVTAERLIERLKLEGASSRSKPTK